MDYVSSVIFDGGFGFVSREYRRALFEAKRKKKERWIYHSFGASCGDDFKRQEENRVGIGLRDRVVISC